MDRTLTSPFLAGLGGSLTLASGGNHRQPRPNVEGQRMAAAVLKKPVHAAASISSTVDKRASKEVGPSDQPVYKLLAHP
jgi:hypothetical protein